jgi:WD40 repeat protein
MHFLARQRAYDAGIVCTKGAVTKYVIATGWDRKLTFFEDSRMQRVVSTRQVPAFKPAHHSDILACALMDESPNLVTASSMGDLKVWNLESGATRSTLEWPGLSSLPGHLCATEALAFLCGLSRFRHICLSVGNDQVIRFWDIKHCCLLHQFFSGAIYISVVASGKQT